MQAFHNAGIAGVPQSQAGTRECNTACSSSSERTNTTYYGCIRHSSGSCSAAVCGSSMGTHSVLQPEATPQRGNTVHLIVSCSLYISVYGVSATSWRVGIVLVSVTTNPSPTVWQKFQHHGPTANSANTPTNRNSQLTSAMYKEWKIQLQAHGRGKHSSMCTLELTIAPWLRPSNKTLKCRLTVQQPQNYR